MNTSCKIREEYQKTLKDFARRLTTRPQVLSKIFAVVPIIYLEQWREKQVLAHLNISYNAEPGTPSTQ